MMSRVDVGLVSVGSRPSDTFLLLSYKKNKEDSTRLVTRLLVRLLFSQAKFRLCCARVTRQGHKALEG